jgi:hypothetical protein
MARMILIMLSIENFINKTDKSKSNTSKPYSSWGYIEIGLNGKLNSFNLKYNYL